jgi:arsenate reductase (glutaredoxin)
MIKIYHHPRCSKSRAGLAYLKQKTTGIQVVEYIKNPITEEELRGILAKMNARPQDVVRKQETIYKKELKGMTFTDDEWIKIILQHPVILRRPIVVRGYRAVVADPPEAMDPLLEK